MKVSSRTSASRDIRVAVVLLQSEFTNIDPTNPIDPSCAAVGVGIALNCGPFTPNFTNDLIYAVAFNDRAVPNASAGFTTISNFHSDVVAIAQSAAAGPYTATASSTASTSWFIHTLAIKRHP